MGINFCREGFGRGLFEKLFRIKLLIIMIRLGADEDEDF